MKVSIAGNILIARREVVDAKPVFDTPQRGQ